MKLLTEGDLRGLVRLLGDDDDWTKQIARNTLLEFGVAARPYLEDGLTHADPAVRRQARYLLDNFAWERLRWEWYRFCEDRDPDLETGLVLIARFAEPSLDPGLISGQLDALATELRSFLRPGQEVSVAAPTLARFFHERHGFRGAPAALFEHPDNSYIHRVLVTKTGIPITLSCLYVLVGRRIGLPVAGVGMPWRFLVRYGAHEGMHVYLDPYEGGRLLTAQSCLRWLASKGVQPDLQHLVTTPDRHILARVLANLVSHEAAHGGVIAAQRLEELRQVLLEGHTP